MKKPNGYWTKDKCHEEALKYTTRTDFKKYSGGANFTAMKNNWLDDICSHMKILKHREKYWTKEKCTELALECKSRNEFHNKYRAAFDISSKNKWLDELCSHMIQFNNIFRCIYAYEFIDNFVYIGLTYDINDRHYRHMSNYNNSSSVYKHMKETSLTPKLIQLTDYLDINTAKNMENEFLKKYQNDNWNTLNQRKTGSLGGNILIWTKEKCHEVALNCKTRTEFYKKYTSASGSALKNGWMDEVCSHMKKKNFKQRS